MTLNNSFSLKLIIITISIFIIFKNAIAMPVFPGAKGFGTETRAAYANGINPTIFIVTNISNEDGTPGNSTRNGVAVKTGSFREACNYDVDNKVILFEVSGTILVNDNLNIDNNGVTVAGQTAPYPGITLRNCVLRISGNNILVQHLRVRVGDGEVGVAHYKRDGINITSYAENYLHDVVVDHCSMSWATDENMGVAVLDALEINTELVPEINVTVSNCIIAEGLNECDICGEGHAAKNLIIGSGKNISILNNLMAHSVHRNPYVVYGKNSVVVSNNLIYNPKDFNTTIELTNGPSLLSIVGNVVKAGPNSNLRAGRNIPDIKLPFEGTKIYLKDNMTMAGTQTDQDDWSFVYDRANDYTMESLIRLFSVRVPPLWPENYTAISSKEVEEAVLVSAGARPAERDLVDNRIVNDVIHTSGRLIHSQNDVGGWPVLDNNKIELDIPNNPHGSSGVQEYTNLEVWLHAMANAVERSVSSPKDLILKK